MLLFALVLVLVPRYGEFAAVINLPRAMRL